MRITRRPPLWQGVPITSRLCEERQAVPLATLFAPTRRITNHRKRKRKTIRKTPRNTLYHKSLASRSQRKTNKNEQKRTKTRRKKSLDLCRNSHAHICTEQLHKWDKKTDKNHKAQNTNVHSPNTNQEQRKRKNENEALVVILLLVVSLNPYSVL